MKNICLLVLVTFCLPAQATPAQPLLFTMNQAQVKASCARLMQDFQSKLIQIKQSKEAPTFDNTLLAFEYALSDFLTDISIPSFLSLVSPSKGIRDQATACDVEVNKMFIDIFTDAKLFEKLRLIKASKQYKKFDQQEKRLFDDYYRSFVSSGLKVASKKDREEIVRLNKELSELSSTFSKNIREKTEDVWVTKGELEGMDEDFINGLEQKNGKYRLRPNYPTYFPLIKHAKNPQTRKKMHRIFATRGGHENVVILEKVLRKRARVAKLMGFANHVQAKLALSDRMAQSPAQVRDFIDTLINDLQPAFDKEYATLQKHKCAENKCKDAAAEKIHIYDYLYYQEIELKQQGDIDMNAVKEYFPLARVTQGMFSIYELLMGIDIVKAQTKNVWAKRVEYYQVFDQKTGKQLGDFYLDLFPREGKYGHAAVQAMRKPRLNRDGSWQLPMSIMMCNFTPAGKDRPSLLTHQEVTTYFHEFGHLVHNMVSKTRFASQGGTSVALDFVEAPSQMLENWAWKAESLQMMASHYKTGQDLPANMLQKMVGLKKVNKAFWTMRQLFLASMDLDYHSLPVPIDTTAHWKRRMNEILRMQPIEGTYYQASFGHLMGYDAGYYGYMWSSVYAQDMFSVFEKKGILNPKIGMRYRKNILEKGGSKPVDELLRKFLRRKPNNKAFLRELGL